jgi:creatinine amidohydrolase/Fe(II)-dependent formamide hydrolase-like protein
MLAIARKLLPRRRLLHTAPLSTLAERLAPLLPEDLPVVTSKARVKAASADYYWYSPKLRAELKGKLAECLVRPTTEAHVVAVASACAKLGAPLTVRGSGTGNYGQAVPLAGGVAMDVSGLQHFEMCADTPGVCRVGAGLKMGELEAQAAAHGWELRMHPSTLHSATVGGFVCGGSGGVGSINYGVLRDAGNVHALRIVTLEEEPRVLELRGDECDPAIHAYGTNGIVTALEMPLAPKWPWHEVIVSFDQHFSGGDGGGDASGGDDGGGAGGGGGSGAGRGAEGKDAGFSAAAAFGLAVAEAVGVVKKQVAVVAAPIPRKFLTRLCSADKPDKHAPGREWGLPPRALEGHLALLLVAAPSLGAVEALAAQHGGTVRGSRCAEAAAAAGGRPLYEYCWNHTTLHALRKDASITYLQNAFEPDGCLEMIDAVHNGVGRRGSSGTEGGEEAEAAAAEEGEEELPELMTHLEFVNLGGRVGAFGIPLLRWSTAERLDELVAQMEALGAPVFNPHTYVLEDGGMKETDHAQLEFKRACDPHGLLNVGKMRAWEEGAAVVNEGAEGQRLGYDRIRGGGSSAGAKAAAAAAKRARAEEEAEAEAEEEGAGGALTEEQMAVLAEGDDRSALRSAALAAPSAAAGKHQHQHQRQRQHQPRRRRVHWEELTTVEHERLDKARAVAVLPIGAVEQHGPHLPVGVDAMHNESILERALALLPPSVLEGGGAERPEGEGGGAAAPAPAPISHVLALPTQRVGTSHEHLAFSGTLSLSSALYIDVLVELGASVARSGVRKIVFFNSHGGQCSHADIAARRLRVEHGMLAVVCNGFRGHWPLDGLFSAEEQRFGIHGGGIETSIMLHVRPDLVQMQHAAAFPSRAAELESEHGCSELFPHSPSVSYGWMAHDLHAAGTLGDAADADAQRGEQVVEAAAAATAKLLLEVSEADVDQILNAGQDHGPGNPIS